MRVREGHFYFEKDEKGKLFKNIEYLHFQNSNFDFCRSFAIVIENGKWKIEN